MFAIPVKRGGALTNHAPLKYATVCVIFYSGPFAPIWENITSSTKLDVHHILHSHHRRTEKKPQVTGTENLVKSGHVVFEIREQTNGQTYTLIAIHCPHTERKVKMQHHLLRYLNKKVGNIVWNLFNKKLDDAEYFRASADQHRVMQLLNLMVMVRLSILRQCVVPRHLLGHGNDECRGSCRRNQR